MQITRSMDPSWLSNTWLVADEPGGHAFLVDSGGPVEPIAAKIAEWEVELDYVLCTHQHHDHIAHNDHYAERYGAKIAGHPLERDRIGSTVDLEHEAKLQVGKLEVQALHIPGHTLGQLAFSLPAEGAVFTGDTLFKGSIGGTRGPGHTTFADIRRSIMDVLMELPRSWTVYPGHEGETTLQAEWEHNPFIRLWRGLDEEGTARCTVFGEPGQLVLFADDYDGGYKAWVRFDKSGDDIVPGSRVRR